MASTSAMLLPSPTLTTSPSRRLTLDAFSLSRPTTLGKMFGAKKASGKENAATRTAVFKSRLQSYSSTLTKLSEETTTHVHKHTTGGQAGLAFGEKLGNVSRLEHFGELKEAFGCVGEAVSAVAKERLRLLGEGAGGAGGCELLGRLEGARRGVVVPTRALMDDREKKVKKVEKETKNFESMRAKAGKAAAAEIKKQEKEAAKAGVDGPTTTSSAASSSAIENVSIPDALLDAADALARTDEAVDKTALLYEEQRVADMAVFLEDFVRREVS